MGGRIFINYRRGDDPGNVGRLFDRLQETFEPTQLFMDVDSIAPGLDFVRVLEEQVANCDVLLAVIGKGWLEARDAAGVRRLDNHEDFVRIEIASALNQGKRVIPVLVGEAQMPRSDDLPDPIKSLARRNAVRLTHERFRADAQGLIKALQQALDEAEAQRQAQADAALRALAKVERRRTEEMAQERAKAERAAEDQARREKEQARLAAIAGLSPGQIAKAEELANWHFIKDSSQLQDFRDHLARFPGGVCERIARAKLSGLVWAALGEAADRKALASYLEEFPDSAYAEQARSRLASLDRVEAEWAARRRAEAQQAFEAAKRRDSTDGIATFLAGFPESEFAEEARTLHAALLVRDQLYHETMVSDDPAVLKAFLDGHPAHALSSHVRRRLRRLKARRWPRGWIAAASILGVTIILLVGARQRTSAPVKPPGELTVTGPDKIEFSRNTRVLFSPARVTFQLRATGSAVRWSSAAAIRDWLDVVPDHGELAADQFTEVVVTPTSRTTSLGVGTHDTLLVFKNETSGTTIHRPVNFNVHVWQPLIIPCLHEECAWGPKHVFKDCASCPEMVVVSAGSFTMGSSVGEEGRFITEEPQHAVTIARRFAVGRFAVTFEEWEACVSDGGCDSWKPPDQGWGRGRRPVINVSWTDAKSYVAWLSTKTRNRYRLLSEAEREYVTRAGTTTPFWWGSSISTRQANYDGKYTYGTGVKGESRARTLPVDSFEPNPWGLYQVHGNVWEWVEDCDHFNYAEAPSNGSPWTSESTCRQRVVRGGGFAESPMHLRAANRFQFFSNERARDRGFRVARELNR
jgi:formylglycine-generating enzyme required for sulfatase activity